MTSASDRVRRLRCVDACAVSDALDKLQLSGGFFVNPQEQVYEGMVVGECSREDEMVVNVVLGLVVPSEVAEEGHEEEPRHVESGQQRGEEADAEENTGKVKAVVPESEDDIEIDETIEDDDDDDSTFIPDEEEGDEDVTDIIGDVGGDEET